MLEVSSVSMAWRDRDDCIPLPLPLPHQGMEVHFSYNTLPLSPLPEIHQVSLTVRWAE